jgi:hypothetical protein
MVRSAAAPRVSNHEAEVYPREPRCDIAVGGIERLTDLVPKFVKPHDLAELSPAL